MIHRSIRVVSAVIQKDGKYLITQRRQKASLPLLWEFPGGRVEPGETDTIALRREVKERLGVDVDVGKPVAFRRHDYEGYSVELVLYEATLMSDDLQAVGVKDFRWVESEDFTNYAFPPADESTLDDLQVFVNSSNLKKLPKA